MTEYGIIEARKPEHPPIGLLTVPHQNSVLTAAYPAFGPASLWTSIERMKQPYSHPVTGERISFRPATTNESISIAAYNFEELAKPQILDPQWLQLGPILKTSEGVWINPLDAKGRSITDEQTLKQLLTKDTIKVNGIYLLNHDGAFVPYDSFQQGVQEARQFAEGGLARALEHTAEKTAPNLEAMTKTCPKGVCVVGFNPTKEPTLRVVGLLSGRLWDGDRLFVGGYDWDDGDGCAFGVRQ